MKIALKFFSRIALLVVLFFVINFSNVFAQSETNNVTLHVDYADQIIYVFYGNDKYNEISLKPEGVKLSFKERFIYTQGLIIDTLNKLNKEGYIVVSSHTMDSPTSNFNASYTSAVVYYLTKK